MKKLVFASIMAASLCSFGAFADEMTGYISEAHCGGWTQIAEAVRQVQNLCGNRQLPNAQHVMYAHGAGDCTIFSREVH